MATAFNQMRNPPVGGHPAWFGGSTSRKLACGMVLGLMLLASRGAPAQETYPSRPIELVVPIAPGGGLDATARLLAELLDPILGVRVVVVNKAGAGGTIGLSYLAAARPDGYTLGTVYPAPLTAAPHMTKLTYSAEEFVPITQLMGGTALIFCVKPNFPARNGKEFVEAVRRAPERYTYANDGVGGMVQLAGERLFRPLGMKLRAVPASGAAESLNLFLGGHVDIYGGSLEPIAGHLKEGKANCVLSTSPVPSAAMPNAATVTDLGMPERATENWRGLIAPKGLSAERQRFLEAAVRKAALNERFKQLAERSNAVVVAGSGEDFRRLIVNESRDFAQVVQSLGLTKQ